MNKIRLQKYLAECGVAARRKAEKLIALGKVTVNGEAVTRLGTKVDPAVDHVLVNGKPIKSESKNIYLKLNKPKGVISSCYQSGEKTILDLVKDIPYRLYPVGRLDKDSEGLILLTNDGELANRLMHPRYEHEKEYLVNVKCPMTPALRDPGALNKYGNRENDKLMILNSGIIIDGKKTLPAKVKLLGPTLLSITLKEGKKRQIRKMIEAVGNRVVSLKRVRIQNIRLGELPSGKYTPLNENEIRSLSSF